MYSKAWRSAPKARPSARSSSTPAIRATRRSSPIPPMPDSSSPSPSARWETTGSISETSRRRPQAAGLIARRVCKEPSNWRSQQSLPQFLERNGVVGIEGVDTRRLVRLLRTSGAQQGIIDSTGASAKALIERARRAPGMEGQDLATKVSTKAPYRWEQGVSGREPQPKRHEGTVVEYCVKPWSPRDLGD